MLNIKIIFFLILSLFFINKIDATNIRTVNNSTNNSVQDIKIDVIDVNAKKIILEWRLKDTKTCTFIYGNNPWVLDNKMSVSNSVDDSFQVILENLKSSSRYFGQIQYLDKNDSVLKKMPVQPFQFKTTLINTDKNINLLNFQVLDYIDTYILLNLEFSDNIKCEIFYYKDKDKNKVSKKNNFYSKKHFILLDNIDNLDDKYFFEIIAIDVNDKQHKINNNLKLKYEKSNSKNIDIPIEYQQYFKKLEIKSPLKIERNIRSVRFNIAK